MLCNMLQGPDGLKRSHIQIRDQVHSLAQKVHMHSYKHFLALVSHISKDLMTETFEKIVWKRAVICSLFQPCLLVSLHNVKRECFTQKKSFLYIEYIVHSQYFTCWYYTALPGLLFRCSLGVWVQLWVVSTFWLPV